MGTVEASIGPEQQMADALGPAPFDYRFDQGAPETTPAEPRLQIQPVHLCRIACAPFDANRSDNSTVLANHKESSMRREVMPCERQKVGHLLRRLEDKPILVIHPTNEFNHSRCVCRAGLLKYKIPGIHND